MRVASPEYCEGTSGNTMDVGVRNRKNKASPKTGKKNEKATDGGQIPSDHEALKKSIEKLHHLNENINRDSVSTAAACMCVSVHDPQPPRNTRNVSSARPRNLHSSTLLPVPR